ncbi:hypothetical protein [Desmospora profundinema]|uniref:Nucleotide sugar dehydrogenase n=1 Tax=Desmospora profundinema TaxID=1571184 RepID=A0ABU1INA9_9BACL|nr:hypothetical protein [Desmospora profundinema]MDR6225888.1 nucleotide sugar dehydrogenase [Desmospora profundinema]
MKIAVLGSGSIGLLTGTCLAGLGHHTWCMELKPASTSGFSASWEAGLNELLLQAVNEGHIHFTTDHIGAIAEAELTFIAVESPVDRDGNLDLSALWKAVDILGSHPKPSPLTVILGEVPLGTIHIVQELLGCNTEVAHQVEFLSPGTGIQHFFHPRRLVIGTHSFESRRMLTQLYRDIPVSIEWMGPADSEWIQYASKAFQAMRLSYKQRFSRLHQQHVPAPDTWFKEAEPPLHMNG